MEAPASHTEPLALELSAEIRSPYAFLVATDKRCHFECIQQAVRRLSLLVGGRLGGLGFIVCRLPDWLLAVGVSLRFRTFATVQRCRHALINLHGPRPRLKY